tara:strand:- start:21013 stop:21219 length:207 start_codon:yes stop_codon:yes gene_type:complete
MKDSDILRDGKDVVKPIPLFADADDIFQARDMALDIIDRINPADRIAALTAFYILWNTLALKYKIEEK